MIRSKTCLVSLVVTATVACTARQTVHDAVTPPPPQVNEASAASNRIGRWSEVSPDSLWCVIATMSDSLVTIGLTKPGLESAVIRGKILISQEERAMATDTVRAIRDVVVLQELPRIPVLQAKLLTENAFQALLASAWVSFVEPDRMFRRFVFPGDC